MKLLNNKFIQTFLAVVPLVLFAICFVSYFVLTVWALKKIQEMGGSGQLPAWFDEWFSVFFILIFLVAVVFLLSTVYFVLHAAQNPRLEKGNMRVVWVLIIILMSGIGNLIYWLFEIRNKEPKPIIGGSINHEEQNEWSGGLYIKS